jgi:hypothetical protein
VGIAFSDDSMRAVSVKYPPPMQNIHTMRKFP